MDKTAVLTPAQHDFLNRTLPGFDLEGWSVELAGRAASQRYFLRIRNSTDSYILIVWDSRDEDWHRFLSIGRDRVTTGNLLPELYADDSRHGLILEEDLGAMTLKRFCSEAGGTSGKITEIYKTVFDALLIWHSPVLADHAVISSRSMDVSTFLWETDYFARYCVKDFCGCESLLGHSWEAEREVLARECSSMPQTAIHRDFQSENVMLHERRVRFVDFQGARLGPCEYDIASLLFDPYCPGIDDSMRRELYHYYISRRSGTSSASMRPFYLCAVQRLMQALGAYANLSLHKGKGWYRKFMPLAFGRLSGVLGELDGLSGMAAVVDGCREVAKSVDMKNI